MKRRVKRLRAGDTAEFAACAALECELFPDEPWSAQSFADTAAAETGYLLCTFAEDRLIGYFAGTCAAGSGEILRVATVPAFRRQGIAADLIWYYLAEMKPAEVFLEVRASNADAISLYRHYDFKEVGVRKRFYHDPTEDAIVMKRGE